MTKTLPLLIALLVVLAAVTPEIVRLAGAITPIVLFVVVALLVWKGAQYFTRR
ncbi:MAG TPA: hypothetical protein VGO31_00265 [Microbacteriaceae bacterium]|jgi:hypothetical protein|nr:hypothetical protein [Microbacteriaceae bacterium]